MSRRVSLIQTQHLIRICGPDRLTMGISIDVTPMLIMGLVQQLTLIMVDMLNKQYYRAPPFFQVLYLPFCLFYLYFSILYMLQTCMVGLIIFILQLRRLRDQKQLRNLVGYTHLKIIEPEWHPGLPATKTGGDINFAQQVTYIQSENLAKDKLYFYYYFPHTIQRTKEFNKIIWVDILKMSF